MWIGRLERALACLLVWLAPAANADVIYQYTGQTFTFAEAPYSTSDFVSGTIQLSSSLAGNVTGSDISSLITAYSFQDGVQIRTQNDPPRFHQGDVGDLAFVSTDANGNITAWSVRFCGNAPPNPNCVTTEHFPNFGFVGGPIDQGTLGVKFADTTRAGVWAIVPEPATGWLILLSLLMLGAVARWRRAAA